MGIIYTNLKLRNTLTDSEAVELNFKIDTVATLLVIPGDMAIEFGFSLIKETDRKICQ